MIDIQKVKREDEHCGACGDTTRNYKYLYEMKFVPNVVDPPRAKVKLCKLCMKELRSSITRLRWS